MGMEDLSETRFVDHFFPAFGLKGAVGFSGEIDVKAFDDQRRSAGLTLTEESEDSYGDVVHVKGVSLKRFAKNPVLLQFHDYSRWPLGTVENVHVDGSRLRGTKIYAPAGVYDQADIGWGLTRAGIMKGQSIGFYPLVMEDIPPVEGDPNQYRRSRRFKKIELLELSDAPVPAHSNALTGKDASYLLRTIGEEVLAYGGAREADRDWIEKQVKVFIEKLRHDAALLSTHGPAVPSGPAEVKSAPKTPEEIAELTAATTAAILSRFHKGA